MIDASSPWGARRWQTLSINMESGCDDTRERDRTTATVATVAATVVVVAVVVATTTAILYSSSQSSNSVNSRNNE